LSDHSHQLARRTRNQAKAKAAVHHQRAAGSGRVAEGADMEGNSLNEEGKMKKAERQKEPSRGNCVKSVLFGSLSGRGEWRR
jgi:hypothetical protein